MDKIDKSLMNEINNSTENTLRVIVQLNEPFNEDEDKKMVKALGGEFLFDLPIINSYVAKLSKNAIKMLALNKRVKKIFLDEKISIT
ncbi:MAG: hypothetical protein ACP5O4_02715 [bacterium]